MTHVSPALDQVCTHAGRPVVIRRLVCWAFGPSQTPWTALVVPVRHALHPEPARLGWWSAVRDLQPTYWPEPGEWTGSRED